MSFSRFTGGGSSLGGFSRFSSDNTVDDPYNTDKLDKQIQNANIRIQDAGYKPQDSDSRNWFEKLTNLPQHQNAFFDTLELLGRPGNAVKNVLDKAIGSGAVESVGEAALKGITGREKVTGADLAEHRGVESGFGRFLLGTVTDIATDPLTYVPGGVLAEGAKMAVKPIGTLAKTAYSAAEKIPSFARFSENIIKPTAESIKSGLGYAFNPNYKIEETLSGGTSSALKDISRSTDNSRAFMQEEAMKGVAQASKEAGGIDTGVDVGRVMEKPLRQFKDVKGYEFRDGLVRTEKKSDLISPIQTNKSQIKELGKELNDFRIDTPSDVLVGNKAFQLDERLIKATKRTPQKVVYVTPKNATAKEIAEIKDINGIKSFRFKGENDFIPQTKVRPVGEKTLTKVGTINKEISNVSGTLEATNKQIRQQYFSKENAALRQLNSRKNKPVNIDELAQSKAFSQVSVSPAFNYLLKQRESLKTQLDELRTGAKEAKQANIEQIGKFQEVNESLKQTLKNPVMIQKEIERPVREVVTDPKIKQAAKTLTESNNTIRQFAEDNGIQIPELEGYMTHVFSQAERDARKINKPISVDSGAFGKGNPNKRILKQRELFGSVEDINARLGKSKFEPNAYFATGIGQKRLIDYTHAVTLRKQVLDNPDFAIPFKKGMDVPKNAEVIDSNNYTFLKESGDSLDGLIKETIGGQYIVTKQAKMVLDRYQKLNTDEGTKAFLKAFDGIQGLWKKGALFSIGYHVRNQAGAMFNNYVGGMNPFDLAKYTKEGFEEVAKSIGGKESEMFTEFRKQGLGSSTLSQVEYAKVGQEPEQAIQKTVENMSKTTGEKVKQRLNPLNGFQTSAELGNFFDQANRFSLYKWSRDKGMSAEEAAQKVRDVQFDYSQTTPFEKNIVTRVFPFYRWMKNNIPFQIKSFVNDPRKYEYLNKARLNAQQAVGLNEDNIPDYMKEQFAIPLYGKNGKGKMLGLNLPLTDLTKLSKPGKTLVDSASAIIKTPAELALNYNMFFGKPIQKFAGQQQQYQIPYTDIAFGIPIKAGYALNQATGQIGKGLSGFLQKPDTKDQDTLNRLPSLGISSMTKPFDAEKYAYYEKLDQLKQAQDLMLFIQQQTGEKPRTLSQIKR